MGVDKSVMERGKRATIKMKQAMCLSQTHIIDAWPVIKSWGLPAGYILSNFDFQGLT
jgi:hypothetical protein